MAKTRELLDRVTALIDKDITSLEEAGLKLTPDDALTLTRYSKTILDLVEREDLEYEREKDELSQYTPDQLRELAIKSLSKKDVKKITS